MKTRKGVTFSIKMLLGLVVAVVVGALLAVMISNYSGNLTSFVTDSVLAGVFEG